MNISIIMPLYNASKYLVEAIQSVLKQTYTQFELICIDDASTDNTLDILKQYKVKDKRIKILLNSQHVGAAESRNRGIAEAKGEYIVFLDGDDVFEEEMLEVAYCSAKKNDVDIVIYEYKHVDSEKIYVKQNVVRGKTYIERYCKHPYSIKDCEPLEIVGFSLGPCNKMFKKNFIIKNSLQFQSLSCCNDVYFSYMAYMLADKIINLEDNRVMVYARDHDVPTRISYDRDPMCGYYAMKEIQKELRNRDLFKDTIQYFYIELLFVLVGVLRATKKIEKAKEFYTFLQKEGIKELVYSDETCANKIESYICEELNKFCELKFSTEWFNDINVFGLYLDKKEDKIIQLIKAYTNKKKKIFLWGAGQNGQSFLRFIKSHNIQISDVVDKDVQKQGQEICGYKIKLPKEILQEADVILTTTESIYLSILAEVVEMDIEVVNLGGIVRED